MRYRRILEFPVLTVPIVAIVGHLLSPPLPSPPSLPQDTWIRDFTGATHVLDVYRQKRVDKRKVFASNYTQLRGLNNEVVDAAAAASAVAAAAQAQTTAV